jgi:CBS domain-containing protein
MLHSVAVKDYMSASLVTFTPDMNVLRAIHTMIEHRISGAPVVDERGNLVGLLSEQDCLKVALDAGYHGEYGGLVSEYMTREVRTVDADTSILEVAKLFLQEQLRRYPVMEGNRLVGQVSRRDVLKALEFLW